MRMPIVHRLRSSVTAPVLSDAEPWLLIAAAPFPIAAEPLDSLAAVRSRIRLGAELFLDFREIHEVLTAQKYKAAPSRDINEIKVRIPAGGVAVLLAISATPAPR